MKSGEKSILCIDQSTSATKAMLFNRQAELQARVSIPHKQHYPQAGYVEHDPEEIFQNTLKGIREVMAQQHCTVSDLECLAITNQRETGMIWDRSTGKPVYNAIVWQCQRGAAFCSQLREDGKEGLIRDKTGLIIDP